HDPVPEADEDPEPLAPEPPLAVGQHPPVGLACQTEPLQLAGVRLVQEVLRGMEDLLVDVLLLVAVVRGSGWGQHLKDHIRKAPALLPGDPAVAGVAVLDALYPEDVRTPEIGPPARHLPRLLHGVVDEHVAADVEVGPPLILHGEEDELAEKVILQDVPFGS